MSFAFYDESIKQQTWVGRALNLAEPIARDGVPWPLAWQTGRPPEFGVFLPESVGGLVPAGEAFVTAQIAIDKAAGMEAPPPPVLPAVRVYTPSAHGTYAVDVPAGVPTVIYQGNRERSYSLIVNAGANPAFLAYSRDADARALPLGANGVGFHELVKGTTSSASVLSPLGTFVTVTDGRYDPSIEGEGEG